MTPMVELIRSSGEGMLTAHLLYNADIKTEFSFVKPHQQFE